MKKHYILIPLIALMPFLATSKTTGLSVPNLFPNFGPGSGNIYPGFNNSRIIAQSHFLHNGNSFIPVDSITYSYSFGRGGQIGKEDMDDHYVNFDESFTYLFEPATSSFRNQFHRSQTYNQNNKAQYYTCQSWRLSTGSWRDSARFVYNYNSDITRLNSTVFQIWWQAGWMDHVDYVNVYDPLTGQLVEMNSTVFEMKFAYDASGNMIQRKEREFSFVYGWHFTTQYSFVYNSSNQLTSYTVEVYDGGWKNSEKYDYAYNANDVESITQYEWTNNSWVNKGMRLISYDILHNKISDEWQVWDATQSAYIPESKLSWTHNNFSQPLTYYSQTWDAASNTWSFAADDFMRHYYYQPYIPTSVPKVNKGGLSLYPQPAADFINFRLDSKTAGQANAVLMDIQGRVLRQVTVENTLEPQTIGIADLPSGNYMLRLITHDAQYAQQVVIAH